MHLFLRCCMSLASAVVFLPAAPRAVSFSQNQAGDDAYAYVGRRSPAGAAKGPAWKSPANPDSADWALLADKRLKEII